MLDFFLQDQWIMSWEISENVKEQVPRPVRHPSFSSFLCNPADKPTNKRTLVNTQPPWRMWMHMISTTHMKV